MSKPKLNLRNQCIDNDCTVGLEFYKFLEESENQCIRLDGSNTSTGEWKTRTISGLHRWKAEYKKRIYAKLQQLNPWYEEHHSPITMVTFTTKQRDLEKWEQIDLLKYCFNKAKKLLNKYLGKFPYVWIMEPHTSGYSHIHMLIFRSVPKQLRYKVAEAWKGSYGAGGFKDSLKFSMSKTQHTLRSAGAYVFKYIEKTLDYNMLSDVTSGYYKQSSWVWKMSKHSTDYTGVRLWGCSRDLSEAMAYTGQHDTDTIWWRVSWKVPDGGWFPVWVDEDMAAYPERIYEFDDWLNSGGGLHEEPT